MEDTAKENATLHPYIIKPTESAPWFSMTRFSPVTDEFYFRDGYLVVLSPFDVIWESPVLARSRKTLEEHIQYIQEKQLEKIYVVAEDISFLRQCPSVKSVKIIPAYSAKTFDYSSLYDLPNLEELCCQTIYGANNALRTDIDYSQFTHLRNIIVDGAKGHNNLASVKGLYKLHLGQGQPVSRTLADYDLSLLEELDICQSTIYSLEGIENAHRLQKINISYSRSLENLSAVSNIGKTLTSLEIQACGKIKDFSWLYDLSNLENLVLFGSNTLPNLGFLNNMPNLKSFRFTMNVLDGDLELCRNVPYVYCKNRKHYNLKNENLPKGK